MKKQKKSRKVKKKSVKVRKSPKKTKKSKKSKKSEKVQKVHKVRKSLIKSGKVQKNLKKYKKVQKVRKSTEKSEKVQKISESIRGLESYRPLGYIKIFMQSLKQSYAIIIELSQDKVYVHITCRYTFLIKESLFNSYCICVTEITNCECQIFNPNKGFSPSKIEKTKLICCMYTLSQFS